MQARRAALTTALATALLAVSATGAAAAGTLQPGAQMQTDTGRCTMNFAYQDAAGSKYMGTAAHCVEGLGQTVSDADGDRFGTVAARGNPDVNAEDYAFVKVDEGRTVDPSVKGSPQYPTGVTEPAETRTGDTLQASGFGLLFDLLPFTRERRVGLLISDDEAQYSAIVPVLFGDSGGPIVNTRTGKALGIVSRLCIGLCTAEGPTVQGAVAKAQPALPGLRLLP